MATTKNTPIGETFGYLTVVGPAEPTRFGKTRVLCQCICGQRKPQILSVIRSGVVRSCGCRRAELDRASMSTHGACQFGKQSQEYRIWSGMKSRCYRPTTSYFELYGGRGISVCERWRESFEAFFADMGPRPSRNHSIDRINNDGNYEPGNCRWALNQEQATNKSTTVRISYNGETLTTKEWGNRVGIKADTIRTRLKRGWPVDLALRK